MNLVRHRIDKIAQKLSGDCAYRPVVQFYEGDPKTIRVDQGSEFISRDLNLWVYQKGVTLAFSRSRPGKPTDNAFSESFNGKFRAECLNTHWFMSLDDARSEMEEWRKDYNEVSPHSAIGNKPLVALMNRSVATLPP